MEGCVVERREAEALDRHITGNYGEDEFKEDDPEEDGPQYMDIDEFVRLGFLQEVNRQFLHPHGLALAVERDDDGNYSLSGIWDSRDDPEGIIFTGNTWGRHQKWQNVRLERLRHEEARLRLFGLTLATTVQPLGHII